ncbi:hypothetical protein GCM10012319_09110 [Comamonas sp. KCTC 72670]|nr:hypothetical protein GCM10012319_09110 [Comamonas sp. KCTC 72670]
MQPVSNDAASNAQVKYRIKELRIVFDSNDSDSRWGGESKQTSIVENNAGFSEHLLPLGQL